jgi:dihydrofolate reductase
MDLTATMFLSVDGVYQGPGGRDEDRSGGFDRGGWLAPFFDERVGAFMLDTFDRPDAFLLGRRTYDIFAGYWPHQTDPGDPVATKLNSLPKYVASTTLREPRWANTTVLDGDLVGAIRDLKAKRGNELQVHGSGRLLRFLLEHDLVDRLNLEIFPVIVGKGMRLFPDDGPDTRLELVSATTSASGVQLLTYRPAGPATYADVANDASAQLQESNR